MMGAFIQLNLKSRYARARPIGYVVQENGCWEWVGTIDRDGYGLWRCKATGENKAHRVTYVMARGTIPRGFQIDHLCRNTTCVNPDHLEAVTCRENTLRGYNRAAVNARRTHCVNGHKFDGDNLMKGKRRRDCRTCSRERCNRSAAKVRAARRTS